jgi:hypothetical protein
MNGLWLADWHHRFIIPFSSAHVRWLYWNGPEWSSKIYKPDCRPGPAMPSCQPPPSPKA